MAIAITITIRNAKLQTTTGEVISFTPRQCMDYSITTQLVKNKLKKIIMLGETQPQLDLSPSMTVTGLREGVGGDMLQAELDEKNHNVNEGTPELDEPATAMVTRQTASINLVGEPLTKRAKVPKQEPPVRVAQAQQRLLTEVYKEFRSHRLNLNHCATVDFTVFEFGDRRGYLIWRALLLVATLLMTCHMWPSLGWWGKGATPYSGLVYMHVWLFLLLTLHMLLDVLAITWLYYTVPTQVLVRMHYTPWYFKPGWFLYNTLVPNILSCHFMYCFSLGDVYDHFGYSGVCHAALSSLLGTHVLVTATPSRLAHVMQPLGLNILYLLFTVAYQGYGYTNPYGDNYVDDKLAWTRHRLNACMVCLVWLLNTYLFHILMVVTSWVRRIIYRWRRTDTVPIYGFSPVEFYPLERNTGGAHDQTVQSSQSENRYPYAGTWDSDQSGTEPAASAPYSSHLSYDQLRLRSCHGDILMTPADSSPPQSRRRISSLCQGQTTQGGTFNEDYWEDQTQKLLYIDDVSLKHDTESRDPRADSTTTNVPKVTMEQLPCRTLTSEPKTMFKEGRVRGRRIKGSRGRTRGGTDETNQGAGENTGGVVENETKCDDNRTSTERRGSETSATASIVPTSRRTRESLATKNIIRWQLSPPKYRIATQTQSYSHQHRTTGQTPNTSRACISEANVGYERFAAHSGTSMCSDHLEQLRYLNSSSSEDDVESVGGPDSLLGDSPSSTSSIAGV